MVLDRITAEWRRQRIVAAALLMLCVHQADGLFTSGVKCGEKVVVAEYDVRPRGELVTLPITNRRQGLSFRGWNGLGFLDV